MQGVITFSGASSTLMVNNTLARGKVIITVVGYFSGTSFHFARSASRSIGSALSGHSKTLVVRGVPQGAKLLIEVKTAMAPKTSSNRLVKMSVAPRTAAERVSAAKRSVAHLASRTLASWIAAVVYPKVTIPGGTPGASNTGVPRGTRLTVHRGDIHVTRAGATINALDIRGRIFVEASNVTIQNSIVRGPSTAMMNGGLISNLKGYSGLRVINTEIAASAYPTYANGIMGFNFSLTRVNIHNVVDAVDITGNNVHIVSSWLHNNLHYAKDPTRNGTPSHDDSIQIQKGIGISITNNAINGAHNAALMVTQDAGSVGTLSLAGNLFDNGACTVNIAQKSYGPLKGVSVANNRFQRHMTVANCAVIAPATSVPQMVNNVWADTGATVQPSKG